MLAHNFHFDRVAQVWLIGAVPQRGIFIGNQRPVLIDLLAATKFLEQAFEHGLDRIKHILLCHKAHFHIELIEISRRAIRARVFIAETRGDLEIFIKARHHQQLLKLLRCLWQRVKLARMQTRRHKEIAGALRARGRDNWGLEFAKAFVPHPLAN